MSKNKDLTLTLKLNAIDAFVSKFPTSPIAVLYYDEVDELDGDAAEVKVFGDIVTKNEHTLSQDERDVLSKARFV